MKVLYANPENDNKEVDLKVVVMEGGGRVLG